LGRFLFSCPLLESSAKIDKESGSKKLFFFDFTQKLFFAFLQGSDSLRTLVTDLITKDLCKELGFEPTPFSTLKDGFQRFDVRHFRAMYEQVLNSFDWSHLKGFSELGRVFAVDGSLFPTLLQMKWTQYKKTANSCKLHLCLDIGRMVATEFMVESGNSSERNFLISIAQAGMTYIADRGYFSFELAQKLHQLGTFFVIRIKSSVLFTVKEHLELTCSQKIPACFSFVSDRIITFNNDESALQYRLICFRIGTKEFRICTNRLEINTLQIIMLYAFRWQIELMFKFIKRTMNGIHFYNNTKNGVQIQIYIIMTLVLLQLRLKQVCQRIHIQTQKKIDQIQEKQPTIESFISYFGNDPGKFIENIAQNFYLAWKISKRFLQILNNSLAKIIDNQLIEAFAVT
jgi:hypothetical protein